MTEQQKSQTEAQKVRYRIYTVLFHYLRECDSAIQFLSSGKSDGVSFDIYKVSVYQGLHPYEDYTIEEEADISVGDNISCQKLEIDLLAAWCEWQKIIEPYGWITIKPPKSMLYLEDSVSQETKIKNANICVGSLISPTDYCPHWPFSSSSVEIYFEHDRNHLSIFSKELGLKFEMSCKSLTNKFIVSYNPQETSIYFETTEKLKMSTMESETVVQRWIPDQKEDRNRMGLSTVLRLSFPSEIIKDISNDNPLLQIIARYRKRGFTVVYGHVNIISPYFSVDELGRSIRFDHFETEYAWQCLLHHGYKVIDSITKDLRDFLLEHKANDLSGIFYEMESKVDNNIFFEFTISWNESVEIIRKIEGSNPGPESNLFVRRIVITPTSEIYLKKEPTKQNRVIRQYDVDYFIRVVFRDEDFGKLCLPSKQRSNPIIKRITDFMRTGFKIGDRHYDFLGCSNSQMREHSVWFCAPHYGETADSIRNSLGDFSEERCVATYVSRLGLCFSASCETVEVNEAILIDDIERNGNCFTDGIGKVSRALAKRISNKLGRVDLSAFQIRYAGCKGVVAVDPNLGEEEILVIRKSMKKFDSSSDVLEILQWTRPGQLFLNRQIITLMSGLGVPDEAFSSLQQRMFMDLANMLIDEDHALKVLCSVLKRIDVKHLKENGINVTKEPFFRSILVTVYYEKIRGLSRKSRIEIPWSNGRIMMGTVDETGILEYGQVFIAFSDDLDTTRKKKFIVEGTVVVAKNPCFHPGDLRKFQAVDIPVLHHMVDCIVFPQNGERPHPDEMSGSDLDGDMYFVCWDKALIPTGENRKPMDFPKSDKIRLTWAITTEDIIDFLGAYIQQDRLGLIANAHVVHADLDGIECEACFELAKIHSDAVDFPKTGKVPVLRKDLVVDRYPDFMMKRDKIMYTSNKVLGKLFQQCNFIENNFKTLDVCRSIIDNSRPDDRYRRRLHNVFKEQAIDTFKGYCKKVSDLMNLYGIETEAELITGMISSMKTQRGNLKNERFEISEIVQKKMATIQEDTRVEFFKEFGGEKNAKTHRLHHALAKASAWYIVAYEFDSCISDYRCLSFPWVVSEFVISVKTPDEDVSAPPTPFVEIGSSIEKHANITSSRRHDKFDDLINLSENFISDLTRLGICQCGDLSLVGIVPLGLINHEDPTITLYTPKPDISSRICKELSNRNHQIVINGVRVMISTDKRLLQKTALIYKVLEKNPHLIFPLLYLLDWARENNFIGSSHDNVCDELTFVFLATCIIRNTTDTVQNDITQTYLSSKVSRWKQDVNLGTAKVKEEAAQDVLKFYRSFINQITDSSSMFYSHCQLTENMKRQLTLAILAAFQELALYNSLESMDDTELIDETITLPYDTWESILFAEPYIAQQISEKTKAYVDIRRTRYGLILDMHGSYDQMKHIRRLVDNLTQHSSSLISTPTRDMVLIKDSCIYVFQGSTSEEDEVRFDTYHGPCNEQHNRHNLKVPILHSNQTNAKSYSDHELFIGGCLKQINTVSKEFDPLFHGDISMRITLGTFYIINAPGGILSIANFSNRLKSLMMQYEGDMRSRKIFHGENRKLQAQRNKMMRKSFMPISCNISIFLELLLQNGFELLHESKSYQATLNLDKPIFGKQQQCNISLDENMKFNHLRLKGLTWMVADVIRQNSRSGSSADIRFKITSFRTFNNKTIAGMEDVKLLLDPDTCVMKASESKGIEICEQFRHQIQYVRKKTVKSYYIPNPESKFLEDLEILLSSNVEYSKLDHTGKYFENQVTRDEISIIPRFPPLSNQDEWNSFLEFLWDFSEKIATFVSNVREK